MKISMLTSEFYTENELRKLGFKEIGENILIDKTCIINGFENISIDSNVRIDAYTIITSSNGFLKIGSNVHIASHCLLSCGGGIIMKDFSGLSSGVKLYSVSDDYLGRGLTNPTVPEKFKKLKRGKIVLEKHVIIGTSSVILPNVVIGEGASVGALSLVKCNLEEWLIYSGSPLEKIGKRFKKILDLELEYKEEFNLDEMERDLKEWKM